MSSARPKFPSQPMRERVPLSGYADRVRDAMALRCGELEQIKPEALDLAAAGVAAVHDALHGQATELRGARSAAYRRQQLRGEHGLTVEDLAQLALDAPESAIALLGVFARALGQELGPQQGTALELHEAKARLNEEHAHLQATMDRQMSDGGIDAEEARVSLERVRLLKDELAAIEASLLAAIRDAGDARPSNVVGLQERRG